MNDRFNIRYFNKNSKKFEYLKIGAVNFNLFTDWTVYEQGQFCTGLKDKNGKLIYEGDIVKIIFKSLNQESINIVEWDNTSARFIFEKFGQISMYNYAETWEVIGNIYENPELLEE